MRRAWGRNIMSGDHHNGQPGESLQELPHCLAIGTSGYPEIDYCTKRPQWPQPLGLENRRRSYGCQSASPQRLRKVIGKGSVILDQHHDAVSAGYSQKLHQFGNRNRFAEDGEQTFADGVIDITIPDVCGHHDRRYPRIDLPQLVDQLRSAHHRHAHVGEHGIERRRAGELDCFSPAASERHLIPLLRENLCQVFRESEVVVDNQIVPPHGQAPWIGRRTTKRAPRAARCSYLMVPPCRSTIRFTRARPRPIPFILSVSSCSNRRPRIVSSTPGPESSIETSTVSPSRLPLTR